MIVKHFAMHGPRVAFVQNKVTSFRALLAYNYVNDSVDGLLRFKPRFVPLGASGLKS